MEEFARSFRNVIIIAMIAVIVVGVCFLTSAILVTAMISGAPFLKFSGNVFSDIAYYYSHFAHWWKQWWANKFSISISYNNFFVVKLFLFTLLPPFIIVTKDRLHKVNKP